MKNIISKSFVALLLGTTLLIASCGKKSNSISESSNTADVTTQEVTPPIKQEPKNLITVDKPYVSEDLSVEASVEGRNSSVYFLVNELKATWGIGQYVPGTNFTVYANYNNQLVPVILTGYSDRGCGRKYMNDAAICYSNFASALTVKFDQAKNPTLEAGKYTAKFNILAKGWHNSSYSKPIALELDLEIVK